MTTPMERALKNLGDVTNVVGPMPIKSGALQGLCSLLAAEVIADAIKEAAHPAKSEPLRVTVASGVAQKKLARKLRSDLLKADI